jgi:hypothetical protein
MCEERKRERESAKKRRGAPMKGAAGPTPPWQNEYFESEAVCTNREFQLHLLGNTYCSTTLGMRKIERV